MGGTLLWLAIGEHHPAGSCNLMMMRYTLYAESRSSWGLAHKPGPRFWIPAYAILDIASIWPYNPRTRPCRGGGDSGAFAPETRP